MEILVLGYKEVFGSLLGWKFNLILKESLYYQDSPVIAFK